MVTRTHWSSEVQETVSLNSQDVGFLRIILSCLSRHPKGNLTVVTIVLLAAILISAQEVHLLLEIDGKPNADGD